MHHFVMAALQLLMSRPLGTAAELDRRRRRAVQAVDRGESPEVVARAFLGKVRRHIGKQTLFWDGSRIHRKSNERGQGDRIAQVIAAIVVKQWHYKSATSSQL